MILVFVHGGAILISSGTVAVVAKIICRPDDGRGDPVCNLYQSGLDGGYEPVEIGTVYRLKQGELRAAEAIENTPRVQIRRGRG